MFIWYISLFAFNDIQIYTVYTVYKKDDRQEMVRKDSCLVFFCIYLRVVVRYNDYWDDNEKFYWVFYRISVDGKYPKANGVVDNYAKGIDTKKRTEKNIILNFSVLEAAPSPDLYHSHQKPSGDT